MLHDFTEQPTPGALPIKRTYKCPGCGLLVRVGSTSTMMVSAQAAIRDYLKQNRIPPTCEDYTVQAVLNT